MSYLLPPISEDIRRFILNNIPSIPYLEAMLLLREDKNEWGIKKLASRLYIEDKVAAGILTQLHVSGLIILTNQNPPTYIYQPKSEKIKKLIDLLAETYSKDLIEVTNLVHANSDKKASKFADAFIWRKDS